MKRALLAALLIAFGALGANAHDWDRQAKDILDRIIVLNIKAGDVEGMCSSWTWDQERGLGITAGHCAYNGQSPNDISMDFPDRSYQVDLISVDPDTDVALLHSEGFKRVAGPEKGYGAVHGRSMLAVGHIFTGARVVKSGIVVALPSEELVIHDAIYIHGMSGGVLVDAKHRVQGLLISTRTSWGTGTAVSIQAVRKFVEAYS
jgi:S1-C subfamily serine protease